MKKLIAIVAALLILGVLCGCATALKKMTVAPAKLTKKEEKMASLLAPNKQSIFDFKIDDTIKAIRINRYRFENGEWEPDGGSGHICDGTSGRIALISDQKQDRIALQDKNSSGSVTLNLPEGLNAPGKSWATSYLSEAKHIIYEEEIPLKVQFFTMQDSISFYDVSFFNQPEKYAQQYEQVYAITITFSQSELS